MDARIPIACSLEADEAKQRSQDWRALEGNVLGVERSDQQLEIRFATNEALRAELGRLVDAERRCCAFVAWELEDRGDQMLLSISGDSFGVTAMVEAFRLGS